MKVFGCSAFGFRDCVSLPDGVITGKDLYLADAVLPRNHAGTSLHHGLPQTLWNIR